MNAHTDTFPEPLIEEPNTTPITRAEMEPGHGQMRVEAMDEILLASGWTPEMLAKRKEKR